jgi:hypothetical protein
VAELLSRRLKVAGCAEVLGVLVYVLPALGERDLVVHLISKPNDASGQAARA